MNPLGAAAVLAAAAAIPWTDDIDAAFRIASERHVPVVVDVWAVWCVPCKRMDDETYRDPAIVEAAKGVVPLKVDADAQPIFVERYRSEKYPEVLFLDEVGREIGRATGFQDAPALLPALRRAAEGYPSYRAWMEGDEKAETLIEVAEYLAALGSRGRAAKALSGPARAAAENPASLPETLRLRLGKALISVAEQKDAAPILFRLSTEGSTREIQGDALAALASLESIRGVKEIARAAAERLAREFPER